MFRTCLEFLDLEESRPCGWFPRAKSCFVRATFAVSHRILKITRTGASYTTAALVPAFDELEPPLGPHFFSQSLLFCRCRSLVCLKHIPALACSLQNCSYDVYICIHNISLDYGKTSRESYFFLYQVTRIANQGDLGSQVH